MGTLPLSRIVAAVLPYAGLALVLKQVPNAATAPAPMPWSHAAGHALAILGLMALHATACARWHLTAPRLATASGALVRLAFVALGALVVAAHPGGPAGLFLLASLAWTGLAGLTHLELVRWRGYRVWPAIAQKGLFLLGLALLGLLSLGHLVLR